MSIYKIYEFSYPGKWMGGKVIVVAKTEKKARESAEADKKELGHEEEPLTLVKTLNVTDGVVAFWDDGSY